MISQETMSENIAHILDRIEGEDRNRDGLKDTPNRVARMYKELFSGYGKNGKELIEITFEDDVIQTYGGMVIVQQIPFFSMCEHHMMPFFGQVDVGYVPDSKVVGLSKIARLVEIYARRLQVQERLTDQVAHDLYKYLHAKGVMVVVRAQHLCMIMRGIQAHGSFTTTSSIRGVFERNEAARQEFLSLTR